MTHLSRRTVLNTVTTVLKTSFTNVSNRFKAVTDLLNAPDGAVAKFPHLNVNMGPQGFMLGLPATFPVDDDVPILVYAFDREHGEALHLDMADLTDSILDCLLSSTNAATMCAAGFGINGIDIIPVENEDQYDIGLVILMLHCG